MELAEAVPIVLHIRVCHLKWLGTDLHACLASTLQTFSRLKSTEHKILTAHKSLNTKKWSFFLLKYSQLLYLSC